MTGGAVTAMIHVPDIAAAVAWYQDVGFGLLGTADDDGDLTWAMMGWGAGRVMFNIGGSPSEASRREADLYIDATDIDAIHARPKDRVTAVEPPHDTFYGMREVIIRDLNGFWLTFGQPA